MEDKRIVELFWQRSDDAVAETQRVYGKQLTALALRVLGSAQDAEECVNDAYLGTWNAIPPQRPNPLLAFVCVLVRRYSIMRYRANTAKKRNSLYDVAVSELEHCLKSADDVEKEVEMKELARVIEEFLDTLSPKNRIVFMSRYWFTDSYERIAARTGLSEKNVSVRLVRIRKQLREYLAERGILV